MDSTFEVRISVNTLKIFLLTSLLLIGRNLADSVKPSLTHEAHQVLARREGTPSLDMDRFRRGLARGSIWTAIPAREDHPARSDSDSNEARNAVAHEEGNAAHWSSARRLLRDISPPGMWPPGSDDYDESLPSFSPSRSLLSATSAAGHRKRPSAQFAERRSSTVRGYPRSRWQASNFLSSESQPSIRNNRKHRQLQLANSRKRKF